MSSEQNITPAKKHELDAIFCDGMSGAAYGVGDMLAGKSYADTANWHRAQAKSLAAVQPSN